MSATFLNTNTIHTNNMIEILLENKKTQEYVINTLLYVIRNV